MASSSGSTENKFKYEVFLSFRGEDLRKNFVDHLYLALHKKGISTYKDDVTLKRGKKISDELLQSIEDSKFYLIVFSKNYASSPWCLDELAKIMDCNKNAGHTAYPVFYDVEPTEVRNQSGAVGEAFARHNNKEEAGKWREALKETADLPVSEFTRTVNGMMNNEHNAYPIFYDVEPTKAGDQGGKHGKVPAKYTEEDVRKWRQALTKAGNLAGYVLENNDDGHEAKFIERIVEQIFLDLQPFNVYIDKLLVGMEHRIEGIMSYLKDGIDEVRMIGISGIGGGGKTALARAVFDKISTDFEGISFVENIRGMSEKFGLHSLQKQVISDVLNQNIIVNNLGHGKNLIRKMLGGKKVLIVLDDVDHNNQLLELAGEPTWFGAGSRIIITTRNEQVLMSHRVMPHGVMPIHRVVLLIDEEAKLLFNRCAFRADIPTQGFQELALKAVSFAGGHPLYIKALGLYLSDKNKLQWSDQLERLRVIPMNEPFKILELSYTSLDDDFKELFLDVACFLKGKREDDAIRILESCWYNARIGLRDLELKSLITISDDQHLDMHDCIQEMGRYIVRRKYPNDPSKHSRLWEHEKIKEILDNELDNVKTGAIALDDRGSDIFANGFGNIKRLRFLHMVSKNDENTHHISQKFPYTLRYLSWECYPYRSLPRTFEAVHLVALELSYCRIETLWDENEKKALKKLRFLVLSHSKLTSLDLDLTPNLERLDLEECQHLKEIQMVNASLQKLVFLNLTGCSHIEVHSLVFIKKLESLEVLHLSRLSLEMFPDIIPGPNNNRLLELHFRDNKIEELPASIRNLKDLVYLDLHFCGRVRSLPGSICGLEKLKDLDLYGCTLEKLPDDIDLLECLEKLNLSRAHINELPDTICRLKKLTILDLSYCFDLEKLPEDIGRLECLEELILTRCEKIREIPGSFCRLKNLKCFCLLHCIELQRLPDGLELIESLEELHVKGTRIKIPESILSLQGLKIDETSSSSGTLKASSTTINNNNNITQSQRSEVCGNHLPPSKRQKCCHK